jgi:hypothetical protein
MLTEGGHSSASQGPAPVGTGRACLCGQRRTVKSSDHPQGGHFALDNADDGERSLHIKAMEPALPRCTRIPWNRIIRTGTDQPAQPRSARKISLTPPGGRFSDLLLLLDAPLELIPEHGGGFRVGDAVVQRPTDEGVDTIVAIGAMIATAYAIFHLRSIVPM